MLTSRTGAIVGSEPTHMPAGRRTHHPANHGENLASRQGVEDGCPADGGVDAAHRDVAAAGAGGAGGAAGEAGHGGREADLQTERL